jgi:glycosyltransferase involved in cell wall biosynthesis
LKSWRWTAVPTIRLVDEIVVPSSYLVDVFSRFGLHARSIPNFVDTNNFRFRSRTPLRPIFLSTRNLEPLYNVGCTLRAFGIVQKRFPNARLTVAGEGSQRSELELLARELRLRDVFFVGRISPSEMPKLYDSADIYLNTPDIDNMPGSIIEAFAAGLPVVTTNAGGIPYLVEDQRNGLMTERGDYSGIASRAIRLLECSTLGALIAETAHRECGRYSWDSVQGEWMNLYCDLSSR